MVLDYAVLGEITRGIEATYDHQHLNDVLKEDMPTSELLAQRIFAAANDQLHKLTELAYVESVAIEETCNTRCEYHAAG